MAAASGTPPTSTRLCTEAATALQQLTAQRRWNMRTGAMETRARCQSRNGRSPCALQRGATHRLPRKDGVSKPPLVEMRNTLTRAAGEEGGRIGESAALAANSHPPSR